MSESKTVRIDEKNQGSVINLGEEKSSDPVESNENPSEEDMQEQVKATINTACVAVEEYAIQLKGRAQEQKVRGVVIVELGVDPKDSGIKKAGAVSGHEVAFAALLIQQLALGNFSGQKS